MKTHQLKLCSGGRTAKRRAKAKNTLSKRVFYSNYGRGYPTVKKRSNLRSFKKKFHIRLILLGCSGRPIPCGTYTCIFRLITQWREEVYGECHLRCFQKLKWSRRLACLKEKGKAERMSCKLVDFKEKIDFGQLNSPFSPSLT